jgi:hypothetical protein
MADVNVNPDASLDAAHDLHVIGADALSAIEALARLTLHEIDRGPGKLDGMLIVRALAEIAYRAGDARNSLACTAERVGLEHDDDHMLRLTRGAALEGRTWPMVGSAQ